MNAASSESAAQHFRADLHGFRPAEIFDTNMQLFVILEKFVACNHHPCEHGSPEPCATGDGIKARPTGLETRPHMF